ADECSPSSRKGGMKALRNLLSAEPSKGSGERERPSGGFRGKPQSRTRSFSASTSGTTSPTGTFQPAFQDDAPVSPCTVTRSVSLDDLAGADKNGCRI
ncbi:unnamed protein product, partial [Phaeothamnion confervicola]